MARSRYSSGAILLHWLIAVAVIVNWRLAETAHDLPDAEAAALMGRHMALGMTILILTVLRLIWRLMKPAPPWAGSMKPWEVVAARAVHTVFYLLLLGLPLGGWLATSFYGNAVDMFGLFTIPALPVVANEGAGEAIFEMHETGGTVMLALIVLHVAGALKHQLIDRDGNLYRMLPFGTPKG
jgi:cytochrome b561